VDIYEDEHNITLKLEVPGIDEKDIDVRVEGNTLTVHGERKIEKEEKEENFRRVERQYGSFTRSFTLPSSVDAGQVSGNYDQGLLKIKLAKKAEAKPKQIKVNVGSENGERLTAAPHLKRSTLMNATSVSLACWLRYSRSCCSTRSASRNHR